MRNESNYLESTGKIIEFINWDRLRVKMAGKTINLKRKWSNKAGLLGSLTHFLVQKLDPLSIKKRLNCKI